MRHIISVLVENEFGVLSRVSGLFSGRGFNIESLCVAETLDPTTSTMDDSDNGKRRDHRTGAEAAQQADSNVIKVVDFKDKDYVSREMVLVKVNADDKTREEVLRMVEIFRGRIIDVSPKTYTIMITGDEAKT